MNVELGTAPHLTLLLHIIIMVVITIIGWLATRTLADLAIMGATMHIDHVALYVHDLEGARAFFERYLGGTAGSKYHNPKTDFQSYFLSFDDGSRLEIMTRPDMATPAHSLIETGYIHLAFGLGTAEAVDDLTARLAADGYEVLSGPRTTGDGYYESCVAGFEGNQIELTV